MRSFQCQESCGGKCCKVDWSKGAAFVFLTRTDRQRLEILLGANYSKNVRFGFFDNTRFKKTPSKQWVLNMPKGRCVFLKDGKCTAYEGRPTQCRTFPYWPELMVDAKWNETAKDCPGIGKGAEDHRYEKLSEQMIADIELRGGV